MTHEHNPDSRTQIAERIIEQLSWLNQAAEIVGGSGATVEKTFDVPPQVRQEAPAPKWSEEQIASIREIAHRFGYGAEHDVPSGVYGGARITEGGLAWKIASEVEALKREEGLETIVFAGSPYRSIKDEERAFIAERYEVELPEDATEYDLAHFFAQRQSSRLADQPVAVAFGYKIAQGNSTVNENTGQLVHVGETSAGQVVQLLRVDREVYEEEGKPKYRFQPDSAALMGFIADVMEAQGQVGGVALITSNTYASRQHDAIRTGLTRGREFGVAMYGRATIAAVRGIDMLPDSPLNQLPGDLRVTYEKLQQLQLELLG